MGVIRNIVAAVGALDVAVRECLLGQRTAVCQDCGNLTDAEIVVCPKCGGEMKENPHPEDYDDGIPWEEFKQEESDDAE